MAKEQLSPALSARMEQEKKTHSYTDFSFHDEAAIRRFPKNILAGMFGFEKKGYFEAQEGAQTAPAVEF